MQKKYTNIFVVDSLELWNQYSSMYCTETDLLLTYDLGLHKKIEALHGSVFYLDHIVNSHRMQENNFLIYKFFTDWHFDADNKDIFTYKGIPFGFALRLEFWNDFVAYIRTYLSLSVLETLETEKIYVASEDANIFKALDELDISYEKGSLLKSKEITYYFPISQWLDEKIRPSGMRAFLYKIRELVTRYYGFLMQYIDRLFSKNDVKKVFIQEYHPTKKILAHLRNDSKIQVLLANFSRGSSMSENLTERVLPIYAEKQKYQESSKQLLKALKKRKFTKIILDDGKDISDVVYKIIEKRIEGSLANILRMLDSSISYLDKNSVDLEILIANIGNPVTLFDAVCKTKGVPSYLIINGLLGPNYYDEAKYATVINSYSHSIKEKYFKGMSNIVVLGDPRMDMYRESDIKSINRNNPVVTIGASGFNSTDLNSYVAVEFDFMYDILMAFKFIKEKGEDVQIIIKVRPNGYRYQYEAFVKKYFSNLNIKIEDTITMREVLLKSDFYISIYSQTLFEASCLGLPVLYYKKDTEIMDTPFNGKSELVTVYNTQEIVQAFYDFKNEDKRYDAFLQRDIMEKYVGPLDGKNSERNLEYIYQLLEYSKKESEYD